MTSFSLYERTGKTEIHMQTKTPVRYCLRSTLHDYYNIGPMRTSMAPITQIGITDVALFLTRLHSSRMRTARLLPVSPSMHCAGGWGCLLPGGCTCFWSRGGYLPLVPGGVCSGGYLPLVLVGGGVCPLHAGIQPPL